MATVKKGRWDNFPQRLTVYKVYTALYPIKYPQTHLAD